MWSISNYGFSCSASVSGSSGVCLNLYVAGLTPSNTAYRANGFQLRCLSE
ncbi:hypothetical protein [uncultured Rikenella sp.]|nr:hypothetical protein [uncultured Rikenella sp.]